MKKTLVFTVSLILIAITVWADNQKEEIYIVTDDVAPYSGPNAKYPPVDDPWDLLFSSPAGATVNDAQLMGGEFAGGHFYITSGSNGGEPNVVYTLNPDGTYNGVFNQWSSAGWGWRDLAYDGSLLYGSDDTTIDAFDLAGNAVPGSNITGCPISPCRALAYDPVEDHFWTQTFSGPLHEIDRTGASLWSGSSGATAYGAAWDDGADDGPWLWIFSQTGAPNTTFHKFDSINHAPTGFIYQLPLLPGSTYQIAGGAFFTDEWDPSFYVLGGVTQGTPDDQIFCLEMYPAGYRPAACENFDAVADPGGALTADLTWDLPTETVNGNPIASYPITSVELLRDGAPLVSLGPTATSYTDNVSSVGLYEYSVYAVNDSGDGIPVSDTEWIGLDVPGGVENLVGEGVGEELIAELTWDNPTAGAHGGYWPAGSIDDYTINRYGPSTATFTLTGIATGYTDNTIPVHGWYEYGVIANNASGNSPEVVCDSFYVGSGLSGSLSGSIGPGTYTIVGNISVENGDSLWIMPGTDFLFEGDYQFDIYGYLYAVGTEDDSIQFLPMEPDSFWAGFNFYDSSDDSSRLEYCIIARSNHVGIHFDQCSPSLRYSTISQNIGDWQGGGIKITGSLLIPASPIIAYCTIVQNSAGHGGGISCGGGSFPYISYCVIKWNTASDVGGGIHINHGSAIISYSTFENNSSGGSYGGAIGCDGGCEYVMINHCTIHGNIDGGIQCYGANSITVTNSIIEGNTVFGVKLYGTASLTYCDCYNNGSSNISSSIPGAGQLVTVNANGDSCDIYYNILEDPLFVDPAGGDYHLQWCSPCINAGDPSSPLDPDSTIADIGVFYYYLSPYRPSAPTNFNVSDNGPALTASLSWTNPSLAVNGTPLTSINSIEVMRNDTSLCSLAGTPGQLMQYDDNVPAADFYQYSIYAVNDSGYSLPARFPAIWIGLDIPDSVLNLQCENVGSELVVELSWDNPLEGIHGGYTEIDGYTINRYGLDTTNFNLTGLQTGFTDSSVTIIGWYQYGVSAYNAAGNGPEVVCDSFLVGSGLSGSLSGSIGPGVFTVIGDISVASGDSLHIAPGTEFLFSGNYSFDIYGYLCAVGTELDSIKFMPVIASLDWSGLDFEESSADSNRLEYCLITGSSSSGLYVYRCGVIFLDHCYISWNYSDEDGGGICSASTSLILNQCTITGNESSESGGGICCYEDSVTVGPSSIVNCIISDNTANEGGSGVRWENMDNLNIVNCTINGNSGNGRGGGISMISSENVFISNCIISGNYTDGPNAYGGGIYHLFGGMFCSYCTISNNTATGYGGGVAGGGYYNHCLINGNSASEGGGVWSVNSLTNCTITGNAAPTGSGIFGAWGSLNNNIVAGNTGSGGGIYFTPGAPTSVTYGDYYDNENGNFSGNIPPGLGQIVTVNANGDSCDQFYNIFMDPQFYSTVGDSAYHLTISSPCIDAGNPASPPDPDSTIADMGAFYCEHPAWWQLLLTCTGEQGTAPNEFYLTIGGLLEQIFMPSPPPPPQYMCWTQLYDSTWNGPYNEMIYQWADTNEYMWRLEIDPNGNVMPPVSRTSVFTWNPNHLPNPPADYRFYIIDQNENIVVYDMTIQDSLAVTGDSTVYYTIKYGSLGPPYVFNLSQYWNLISLPVTPDNPSLSNLFPNATVAFAFENATYVEADTFETGKAYWLYVPEAEDAPIWGMPFTGYSTSVTPPWEMLGSVSEPAIPVVSPGEIVVMYGFDQTYYQVPDLTMNPGLGYWVNFTDDVTTFSLGDTLELIGSGSDELAVNKARSGKSIGSTDEDWELPMIVTGEEGGAPNQFTVIIGGGSTQNFTPAPPPPPEYMTYAQLYDTLWNGPYYEMTFVWPSVNNLLWRLEIDPNGNVMPPEARTATVTWDPESLPAEGDFFILNAATSDTVIADMRVDSAFSTTGTQNVYFNIFAVPPPTAGITITLTPFNPPIQIPASGGNFDFNIAVANNSGETATFDVWCDVTLPDSSIYGPLIGPINVTLPAGVSPDRNRTQAVPAGAPSGTYSYNGYVGVYPDTIWNEDHFDFEKLSTGDGPRVDSWKNTGEPFDPWMTTQYEVIIPEVYSMEQNYPNPFNPFTTIRYGLPEAGRVHLAIYNLLGQRVVQLVDGYREAGYHEVSWDAKNVSSGIYFCQIQAGDFISVRKMVLVE